MRARVLGASHPDTLVSLNYLAVLYKNQGLVDKAEDLYLQCLEDRRSALGDMQR